MAAAQLRRPVHRPDLAPVNLSQAPTALEALTGYTTAPAGAVGHEHLNGSIAKGFRADLTVLASNPLTIPAAELAETAFTQTAVGGTVYDHS